VSKKVRRRKTKSSTPTSRPPSPMMPTPAPSPPTLPSEVRDELTILMQELLVKTHELSFEYSTSDCTEIRNCGFAEKSRELFKVVKKLNALVRKIAPPMRGNYVR